MGVIHPACLKRSFVLAVMAGAFAVSLPGSAEARENTATMEVYLKVTSACRVQTDRLDFGFPAKGAKTASASTTITLNCTPGVNYRVGIDDGQYFDNGSRRMYGGQSNGVVFYVPYRIYHDAARSLPWDNLAGSAMGTMPLTGSVTLPVFGTADLKNVRANEYRDTVTVVLEF
jgi:spore coat protein U-like protein